MPRKRLFLVAMLTNIVLFGAGRTIHDRNFKFDVKTIARKTREPVVNESFGSKVTEAERLKSRAEDRDTCAENCSEQNPNLLNRSNHLGESCPYESKELCLIFSLSKIAKVQVATLNEASVHRPLKTTFDGLLKSTKSLQIDGRMKQNEQTSFGFVEQNRDDNVQNFTKPQTKPPNVHCRAIRDVYIPEAKRNLPAFACKFGNNTFILSSIRFLQDRRSNLDVHVDENILKDVKSTPKISRNSEFNLVPALLVLNVANNDYRIEMQENLTSGRKVNRAKGNR